jgi:hypothetical protein
VASLRADLAARPMSALLIFAKGNRVSPAAVCDHAGGVRSHRHRYSVRQAQAKHWAALLMQ